MNTITIPSAIYLPFALSSNHDRNGGGKRDSVLNDKDPKRKMDSAKPELAGGRLFTTTVQNSAQQKLSGASYIRQSNQALIPAKPNTLAKREEPSLNTPKLQTKKSQYSIKQIALAALGIAALAFTFWKFGFQEHAPLPDITFSPPLSTTPPSPSFLEPEEIKIFTSYTTDIPERLKLSKKVVQNQLKYCQKRGYHYEVYEKNLAYLGWFDQSLPQWSKIAGIMQLLASGSAKWYVWLDDDAVILDSNMKMEDFIGSHGGSNPNTHIIVTKDLVGFATEVNTGVLIVRNSDESRAFFKKLWNKRHEQIFKNNHYMRYSQCPGQECFHEQEVMHELLKDPQYRKLVNIIPQRDANNIGINLFQRFDHHDYDRCDPWTKTCPRFLSFKDPPENACDPKNDFICQCTGLAIKGHRTAASSLYPTNLRLECIDDLVSKAK